jgi:hypothetical protein
MESIAKAIVCAALKAGMRTATFFMRGPSESRDPSMAAR